MIKRLRFLSNPAQFGGVRLAVRDFAVAAGCGERLAELLVLAVDEACANIHRHACAGRRDRVIRLVMERQTAGLRFVLRDYGRPCAPRQVRGRDLLDFRPGGLGTHLIREAFDSVEYVPCARGTRLVLTKQLHPGEGMGARS